MKLTDEKPRPNGNVVINPGDNKKNPEKKKCCWIWRHTFYCYCFIENIIEIEVLYLLYDQFIFYEKEKSGNGRVRGDKHERKGLLKAILFWIKQ